MRTYVPSTLLPETPTPSSEADTAHARDLPLRIANLEAELRALRNLVMVLMQLVTSLLE